ncbi:MAG: recombinase family protein, partial [Methylobacteriaceae bacterium]|nr:recombinase family protein [Methylobacteriaceae bacterium]
MRRAPARHDHSSSTPKILRCAIYTRVSTDHGLDQDFNSLDAQREACSAYIKSQAHEGWRQNREHYDDGGFSGGSIDRPALQRLLEDIRSRKVDVIVVYKVDRLTRSLADFAKLVELFDDQGVAFVSVTQSFNTTSSMGRLTLNVLLSFAQFEREVTGERIRDKIAASKKKGIWVGGIIPFGYRLENHKLVIEEDEAKIVRLIFERYPALGSIRVLEQELRSTGILTRRRELSTGRVIGGIPFTRGPIAYTLKNRTYIGELNHRKTSYPADHELIVSRAAFDAVQKQLQAKRNARAEKHQASGALLIGKLFDQYGRPMTPTYACKGARRYRYYVSRPNAPDEPPLSPALIRLRGEEIEQAVINGLREATTCSAQVGDDMRALIHQALVSASLHDHDIKLTLCPQTTHSSADSTFSIPWKPASARLCSVDLRAANGEDRPKLSRMDPKSRASLVRAIARGRAWLQEIVSGESRDAASIA